jgi:hypothetical protein
MRTGTSILLAVALAAFVGCEKSDTGGPGKSTPPSLTDKITGQSNTFSIKDHTVSVTQGAKEPVDIAITRHTGFDQAVKLTFDPPAKVLVKDDKGTTIKEIEIKDKETKAKVFIEAAGDAPVADETIKVTAQPEKGGEPAHVNILVKVKSK